MMSEWKRGYSVLCGRLGLIIRPSFTWEGIRVERKGPHLIAWIDSSVTRLLVQSFVCQPNTISYHMVTFRRTFCRPVPLFVIRILSLWCNHTIKTTMNFLIVKIGLIVWSGIDISLFSHLQIFRVYKKDL